MHSVCYSNMGIGVQAYLNRAVIKKRIGYDAGPTMRAFGELVEVDEELQKGSGLEHGWIGISLLRDESKEESKESIDEAAYEEEEEADEPGEPDIEEEFA